MNIRWPALAFATCALIWGGSWIAIRAAVHGADPTGVAATRAIAAAAILLGIAAALRIPSPGRNGVARALVVGTVFIGANFALVYWSAPRLPVGLASLLYATTPLQAAVLSASAGLRDRLGRVQLLGLILGLAAVAVAFGGLRGGAGVSLVAALAVLAAAATSALGTVLARKWNDVHPLWMNVYANLAGSAVLWLLYAAAGDGSALPRDRAGWWGFSYMLLGGSVLAFFLYFSLARAWDAARASFTTLTTPFLALLLGGVMANEPVLPLQALGAVVLLAAGYLVLRSPQANRPQAAVRGAPG